MLKKAGTSSRISPEVLALEGRGSASVRLMGPTKRAHARAGTQQALAIVSLSFSLDSAR